MADYDKVYIQAVKPTVVGVKPLRYEVNIDDTKDIIEELLNEPMDPKAAYFSMYDEAKAKIEVEINIPQAINNGKKRIENLRQASSTLLLTKGKGDDVEDDVEDEVDETKLEEEEEPIRKKGKVIITRPTKSSAAVFNRRTSRKKLKLGKEVDDVILKHPPPIFQEKIKENDSGAGMENFKSLIYETRNVEEKKQVEDMIMSKLGKRKYSPDQLAQQIPNELKKKKTKMGTCQKNSKGYI